MASYLYALHTSRAWRTLERLGDIRVPFTATLDDMNLRLPEIRLRLPEIRLRFPQIRLRSLFSPVGGMPDPGATNSSGGIQLTVATNF